MKHLLTFFVIIFLNFPVSIKPSLIDTHTPVQFVPLFEKQQKKDPPAKSDSMDPDEHTHEDDDDDDEALKDTKKRSPLRCRKKQHKKLSPPIRELYDHLKIAFLTSSEMILS